MYTAPKEMPAGKKVSGEEWMGQLKRRGETEAYHCASSDDMGACTPRPSESNAAKASIAYLFKNLELVLQAYGRMRAGGPAAIRVVRDCHDY